MQDKKFVINNEIMKVIINRSDIMIANLGLHYYFQSVGMYGETLRVFSHILQNEMIKDKRKQVVFRATLPQHFLSKANTGLYEQYNPNASCAKSTSIIENHTNALLKAAAEKYGFKYLNNYYIYRDRFDLHSRTKKGDCTHYCYTPELIIPELILLEQLIW